MTNEKIKRMFDAFYLAKRIRGYASATAPGG